MAVPLRYNVHSLFYRKTATILTILAVALTVAVLVILMAVQQGFRRAVAGSGRTDNVLVIRDGATSEGESSLTREDVSRIKAMSGIAVDKDGTLLVAGEMYAGISLPKVGSGPTNVALRGVGPESFRIRNVRVSEGRKFTPGTREIVVGRALQGRIQGCRPGGVVSLGRDECAVVGILEGDGAFDSEIWGDVELLMQLFNRPSYTNAIFRVADPADVGTPAIVEGIGEGRRVIRAATGIIGRITERLGGVEVTSERDYFVAQSGFLGATLIGMTALLSLIMGAGALCGCTNTLLASVAGRTREIGGLLAIGFRPRSIFLGFLAESLVIAALGGAVGTLLTLPIEGLQTGTTNWQTFTEQAFTLRIDMTTILAAIALTALIGTLGGILPAWRAAHLEPVEALRQV